MESIDIKTFTQLKSCSDYKILDIEIINYILNNFEGVDVKKTKKNYQFKKSNQILKNPKIKLIKEKNSNKINLILNKLSENNLQNLLLEFFQNIKILSIEDYNEFIKTIYIKMLNETKFLKSYFEFFKNIIQAYKIANNWDYAYFYDLVENKFCIDYFDLEDNNWDFLKDYENENYRINNLNIIKEMVELKFLSTDFLEILEDQLLNQNKYLSDIYYYFKDTKMSKQNIEKINVILNIDIQIRDKILLQNLISENVSEPKKNKIIFKRKAQPLPLEFKIENILTENIETIQKFIEANCIETNEKNKFCETLIKLYFNSNDDDKYIDLIIVLINEQILFKSNFSKGLLNQPNLTSSNNKEKKLLLTLKNLGITKGLESLLNKYNIEVIK
jgi:hypothetical protein